MNSPAIALLRKDLRITRILWAPMIFSYGAFLLMFMENIWVYLAAAACLTWIAALTAIGIDDRFRMEPFLAALPASRRDLVAGRYLAWGIVTAAGLALFLVVTALLQGVFGGRVPGQASLLSLKGVTAYCAGTLLAGAAFLPFYFRFGLWPGMWRFVVSGFGIAVVILNAASGLLPAAPAPAGSAAALPGFVGSTSRGLRCLAALVDRHMGRPVVAAASFAVLAAVAALSFRLSARFYARRDL